MEKRAVDSKIVFVRKLIRMRKAILRLGLSNKQVGHELYELEALINYNKYDKPHQASKFFVRKQNEILSLMPGKACKAHESLMSEFRTHFTNSIIHLKNTQCNSYPTL